MDVLMENKQQTDEIGPKRQSHLFIRGPIPVWWIQLAGKECGPSAVIVGILLFLWMGLKRKPAPISRLEIGKWGISRNTRDAALKELLSARLITITKSGKRSIPLLDLQTRKPLEMVPKPKDFDNKTGPLLQGISHLSEPEKSIMKNDFWRVFVEE
jgi:hypothetical protein